MNTQKLLNARLGCGARGRNTTWVVASSRFLAVALLAAVSAGCTVGIDLEDEDGDGGLELGEDDGDSTESSTEGGETGSDGDSSDETDETDGETSTDDEGSETDDETATEGDGETGDPLPGECPDFGWGPGSITVVADFYQDDSPIQLPGYVFDVCQAAEGGFGSLFIMEGLHLSIDFAPDLPPGVYDVGEGMDVSVYAVLDEMTPEIWNGSYADVAGTLTLNESSEETGGTISGTLEATLKDNVNNADVVVEFSATVIGN